MADSARLKKENKNGEPVQYYDDKADVEQRLSDLCIRAFWTP